ncbi:MAG TPA: GtrA family protein [Epsilonproteobacteria bacterium]|nr:GtrA family protein [Campylobacterota bacterium]
MFDQTFVRFVIVGVVNTVIGYSIIMILFHLIGLSYSLSYFLSYVVGIIVSFFLNRQFVFFSENNKLTEFFRFLIAFGVSYGVSYAALYLLVEHHLLGENIAFFAGMVVYSTLFYLLNKHITFKKR